jgi:NAD(P)H-hydrate repair Nnr-like enzyme with NAD(P)H-hydrate epimerase domain
MTYLTSEGNIKKFKLLDDFLNIITIEELSELISRDMIVDKLRTAPGNINIAGPIQKIIDSNNQHELEIVSLREDIKSLIRAIDSLSNQPVFYSNDLNNLRSKYY